MEVWHQGRGEVEGWWMGEWGQRREGIRTQRKRFPLGVSSASFFLFSIWPWSWLYCSMQLPYVQHIVNGCQYFEWRLVTALQRKLKHTLHKQAWSIWGQRFHFSFLFLRTPFLYFRRANIWVKDNVQQQPRFLLSRLCVALHLRTRSSITGISRGRLLLSLFYCSALQSISDTTARAEPINHLARLLKQIAAS